MDTAAHVGLCVDVLRRLFLTQDPNLAMSPSYRTPYAYEAPFRGALAITRARAKSANSRSPTGRFPRLERAGIYLTRQDFDSNFPLLAWLYQRKAPN